VVSFDEAVEAIEVLDIDEVEIALREEVEVE
jgi:hypothetical protein